MPDRHFGSIEGVMPGADFESRQELSRSGVHRPNQAGISGSAAEGADSIVLSGGYVDDEDFGDVIIYTGHGGNDPNSRRQIRDQELTHQNLALAVSCEQGLPVRVTRGSRHRSEFSPAFGYRYAGLYRVESYWHERGRDGFFIWRYRLQAIESVNNVKTLAMPIGATTPSRVESTIQRIVRSSAVVSRVKAIHGNACQVCGEVIQTKSGTYSEAAHIRPLGRPHDGQDTTENVLCLCPNHHTMFDLGGMVISDALDVVSTRDRRVFARLRTDARHPIDAEAVSYHRSLFE